MHSVGLESTVRSYGKTEMDETLTVIDNVQRVSGQYVEEGLRTIALLNACHVNRARLGSLRVES